MSLFQRILIIYFLFCSSALPVFSAETDVVPRSKPETEGISSEAILKLIEAWDQEPGTCA